jgi:hypothetical protein
VVQPLYFQSAPNRQGNAPGTRIGVLEGRIFDMAGICTVGLPRTKPLRKRRDGRIPGSHCNGFSNYEAVANPGANIFPTQIRLIRWTRAAP